MIDVLWAGAVPAARRRAAPPRSALPGSLPGWALALLETDLATLAGKMTSILPAKLGYGDSSLYLYEPQDRTLRLADTTHSRPIELILSTRGRPKQLLTAALRGHGALITDDVGAEYERLQIARADGAARYADDACVIAPLRDGGRLWGVVSLSTRRAAGEADCPGELLFAFLARALSHARQHEKARRDARVDPLTGVFNRRWLIESLDREIPRAQRFDQPLALLAIDLDGLKQINDRNGHAAGDAILRHVAGRITSVLRHFDGAARTGGDEFVIMLPATDMHGAGQVAHRLIETLRANIAVYRGIPLPITASVGVVQWQPGWTPEQLLETADEALYAAKSDGRDRIVCRGEPVEPDANAHDLAELLALDARAPARL